MRALLSVVLTAALGCSVNARSTSMEREVPYACSSDADCSEGRCLSELGICALERGEITRLLFEITPQASDPVYGGARFLIEKDIPSASDLSETEIEAALARGIRRGRMELNVPPRVAVRGRVKAASDQFECVAFYTPARTTLAATLTFTPRQRLLGLSLESYVMSTSYDLGEQEYVFQGALPPGDYDVYVRPDEDVLGPDCRVIPQIFRNRRICAALETCNADAIELEQPAAAVLRLTITWNDNLEGWLLDMIHPVTGEIISNRVRLSANDVSGGRLVTTLSYSGTEGEFADELVRLTPPPSITAGTVLLQRSGLELLTPGEGAIGDVATFGSPVEFQAWVWKENERDSPVPGVVSFDALDLDAVPEGVPVASFSASAEINAQGLVRLSLLPGQYRVRVTPPALDDPALGLLAAFEDTVTVWPLGSGASQAGHVIEVPAAATLEGEIVVSGARAPLRGVEVRASASPERDPCAGVDASQAASCERPPARVLREALAQDPFIPRTRSALSDGTGKFELDGLDCGACEPNAGATFDLSIRPPAESGLAWFVRPSISLDSSANMGPLELPPPVVRAFQLTYADPAEPPGGGAPVARALSGALVRAFAIVDNEGRVVNATDGLVPCVAIANLDGSRCLQSLRQVAEVRSDLDGEFLLLVPARAE